MKRFQRILTAFLPLKRSRLASSTVDYGVRRTLLVHFSVTIMSIVFLTTLCHPAFAQATPIASTQCKSPDAPVGNVTSTGVPLQIDPLAVTSLKSIGISQDDIFKALQFESVPEARGCWASPTGDTDDALLSIGALQWNFGSGTLQKLLTTYRSKFKVSGVFSETLFSTQLAALMPTDGKWLFTEGCLRLNSKTGAADMTAECQAKVRTLQDRNGNLTEPFRDEMTALFSSDVMRQVQVDDFVDRLTGVQKTLAILFPNPPGPTIRDIKWAIDTNVQQGSFPALKDIARVRKEMASLTGSERVAKTQALISWYDAMCLVLDQEGIVYDCRFNLKYWPTLLTNIAAGNTEGKDQFDLLYLTFLNSITAKTKSGAYEALTFERRARIAFGAGYVAGSNLPSVFADPDDP